MNSNIHFPISAFPSIQSWLCPTEMQGSVANGIYCLIQLTLTNPNRASVNPQYSESRARQDIKPCIIKGVLMAVPTADGHIPDFQASIRDGGYTFRQVLTVKIQVCTTNLSLKRST